MNPQQLSAENERLRGEIAKLLHEVAELRREGIVLRGAGEFIPGFPYAMCGTTSPSYARRRAMEDLACDPADQVGAYPAKK